MPTCNYCGCKEFKAFHGREAVMCASCQSMERTRVLKLVMDKIVKPSPRWKVMHLAPELSMGRHLKAITGKNYNAFDIDPPRYPKEFGVKKLDLVSGAEKLPSRTYDLILHSHVMEHIPCNVTAVLFHLHRALKRTGYHVFSVPLMWGCYEETLAPISAKEREDRFGQDDHTRRFGREDLHLTLGKLFRLPEIKLLDYANADELREWAIPEMAWSGHTSHSFFVIRKGDLLLK